MPNFNFTELQTPYGMITEIVFTNNGEDFKFNNQNYSVGKGWSIKENGKVISDPRKPIFDVEKTDLIRQISKEIARKVLIG